MIAEHLAGHLAQLGYGVLGETMFVGIAPTDPDAIVAVLDESAPQPNDTSDLAVDVLGAQVIVRGMAYNVTRDHAWAIHRSIAGFGGRPLASGPVVNLTQVVTPPHHFNGERRLHTWTAHYLFRVESTGDEHRHR